MNPLRWLFPRNSPGPGPARDKRLTVSNPARQSILATSLEVADTAPKRSKGLLGRQSLSPGQGLWIVPCESVHTFWMNFPIDLVYIDRKHRIRKLRSAVGPWRISACLSAHSVLELPAGAIQATKTQPGDTLEFSESPDPEDNAGANGIQRARL